MPDDHNRQLVLDKYMDIDQKATANRVRAFLDNNFERYLNWAGLNARDLSINNASHLSSPQFDSVGGSDGGNHEEAKVTRIIESDRACRAIYKAITTCSDGARTPYRTILTEIYLKRGQDIRVQALLNYQASRYSILKRRALCEFADRFDMWKVYYEVGDLPELLVLKKDTDRI